MGIISNRNQNSLLPAPKMAKNSKQTRRGRPVEHPLPEPIPDTPENIMKAFVSTPPRKREDWKFVQEREQSDKTATP